MLHDVARSSCSCPSVSTSLWLSRFQVVPGRPARGQVATYSYLFTGYCIYSTLPTLGRYIHYVGEACLTDLHGLHDRYAATNLPTPPGVE